MAILNISHTHQLQDWSWNSWQTRQSQPLQGNFQVLMIQLFSSRFTPFRSFEETAKTHKICNLTLEKPHLGILQWIDFNNCEIHLIHKEADLKGKVCPWNSLVRKCWKKSVIWKLSIADSGFLKVWNAIPEILTVWKRSNGSIICIFTYTVTWFMVE